MKIDDVIAAYLTLRKRKEETAARHKEEMAPINDQMHKCAAWIQQQLQNQGLTNMKSESGIAFLQTDTTVSVKDWDATFEWIKSNNHWQFLERRVSKSVVQDYIEAYKEVPPGVSVTSEISAHIRKS